MAGSRWRMYLLHSAGDLNTLKLSVDWSAICSTVNQSTQKYINVQHSTSAPSPSIQNEARWESNWPSSSELKGHNLCVNQSVTTLTFMLPASQTPLFNYCVLHTVVHEWAGDHIHYATMRWGQRRFESRPVTNLLASLPCIFTYFLSLYTATKATVAKKSDLSVHQRFFPSHYPFL